ncbi:MAG TPA: hypothetical protein VF407_15085 [Polyangiaceae bacterium]
MIRHRWLGLVGMMTTVGGVALAASVGACSSSSDASAPITNEAGTASDVDAGSDEIDSGNGAPSSTYPAPHPELPTVLSFGGPVLTAPHVIPVFFPGDEYQTQLESYLHQLAASDYWAKTTGEYGVGALTVGDSIVLADPAAANVTAKDVDGLAQALASGTVAIQGTDAGAAPVVDGNTVFALFYPTSTTISEAQGYDSCQSFGGYHADTNVTLPSGQVNFTYALVPRCPDFYASEGLTGVDEVTAGLSHELVEAATDPFTETKAAYLAADDDHKVWGVVLAASEAGDMCSWEMPSVAIPNGVDLKTSRIWSNVAAKAGHDPCVPAPSDPYFNAVPDLSEDVSIPEYISYGADGKLVSGGKTKGVKLAVGESATVDLVIYSDGPTAPITITPQEITTSPVLSLSLDRESGVNGERLHLTITRTAKSAARTGAKILLYSSIGAPTSQSRFGISMIYVAD